MAQIRDKSQRDQRRSQPKVGLWGILGAGNIGNDGSMEVMLRYLEERVPHATVDVMAPQPDRLRSAYGLDATALHTRFPGVDRAPRYLTLALIVPGRVLDALRTARWVRSHSLIIIPGSGYFEASLPLRPWETPYAIFLLSICGRLFGTRVAFVNLGAGPVKPRLTRWLLYSAARLAFYRSYRDTWSRDAMTQNGVDTSKDEIYADLSFAIPTPPPDPGDLKTVAVGLMEYSGGNDDRSRQQRIHSDYIQKMAVFVRWLVDHDRRVRFLVGDECDESAVQEILRDLRETRPAHDPDAVVAESVSTFHDLIDAIAPVHSVVATRFHNVVCALKLGKPTVSVGYSMKNQRIMTDFGLSEFCQAADSIDVTLLIEQLTKAESEGVELTNSIGAHAAERAKILDEQFSTLFEELLPSAAGARPV